MTGAEGVGLITPPTVTCERTSGGSRSSSSTSKAGNARRQPRRVIVRLQGDGRRTRGCNLGDTKQAVLLHVRNGRLGESSDAFRSRTDLTSSSLEIQTKSHRPHRRQLSATGSWNAERRTRYHSPTDMTTAGSNRTALRASDDSSGVDRVNVPPPPDPEALSKLLGGFHMPCRYGADDPNAEAEQV